MKSFTDDKVCPVVEVGCVDGSSVLKKSEGLDRVSFGFGDTWRLAKLAFRSFDGGVVADEKN